MSVQDIKAFHQKYSGKGTSAEDIAKAENITVDEAKEAKAFILQHTGWPVDTIASIWAQMQFSKTHPYVPVPSGLPSNPWSPASDPSLGPMTKKDYWSQMETLIETVVRRVMGK